MSTLQTLWPTLLVALFTVSVLGVAIWADDDGDNFPPAAEIAFASDTAHALESDILAALLHRVNLTTAANAANGLESLFTIFDNDSFRLVGVEQPLDEENIPRDEFEVEALAKALVGDADQGVSSDNDDGDFAFRLSLALNNSISACSICHPNFGPPDPGQWVGALMIKVPIAGGDDD